MIAVLLVALSLIIIALWSLFVRYVFRTTKASTERQRAVLIKLIRSGIVYLRMPWVLNPEIEEDPHKKQKKKKRFYKAVRSMAVNMVIAAILFFLTGFLFVKRDPFAFWAFSGFGAPLFGFSATFYLFLWHLMKKLDYVNSENSSQA